MSLHNLATVFGPTLLRPSEVESKAHLTSAADIWSHDVMAQVRPRGHLWLGEGEAAPRRVERKQLRAHSPSLLSSWVRGLQAVTGEAGLWTALPFPDPNNKFILRPRGQGPGWVCLSPKGSPGARKRRGPRPHRGS